MTRLAELSHCHLYQDQIGLRNKQDYRTITDMQRPYAYTIVSKSRNNQTLWRLARVMCLGPQERFLLNGRGDGFPSPLDAAIYVNDILKGGLE